MGHKFRLAQCFGQRSGNIFPKKDNNVFLIETYNIEYQLYIISMIKVKTSTFDTKLMINVEKLGYHNWPILGHKLGLAQCFGQRSGNVFLKQFTEKAIVATKSIDYYTWIF